MRVGDLGLDGGSTELLCSSIEPMLERLRAAMVSRHRPCMLDELLALLVAMAVGGVDMLLCGRDGLRSSG